MANMIDSFRNFDTPVQLEPFEAELAPFDYAPSAIDFSGSRVENSLITGRTPLLHPELEASLQGVAHEQLREQLAELEARNEGWTVEIGPFGKGTYTQGRKIVIENLSVDDIDLLLNQLGHEVKHALVGSSLADFSNESSYIASVLKEEGMCKLNSMRLLDEAGKDVAQFARPEHQEAIRSIWDQYRLRQIDEDTAAIALGELVYRNARGSSNGNLYPVQAAKFYRENIAPINEELARKIGTNESSNLTP
jgi:hypothetical protein